MTFDFWTFLFEIVNFVVLAYVLHRLLYRPLRAAIDKRRAADAQAHADAEQARADAIAMQKQLQSQLADIEKQRLEAIRATREAAEAERRKLIADGEKMVARRQEEARHAIELQREDALRSLRAEVNSAAAELAERLLREAADATLQQQLIKRLVETLRQLSPADRAQVRGNGSDGEGVVLETAAALDAASVEQLNQAVGALVGRTVDLAVETRPALVAGARLRIGGHIWDASLAGQLETLPLAEPIGAENA